MKEIINQKNGIRPKDFREDILNKIVIDRSPKRLRKDNYTSTFSTKLPGYCLFSKKDAANPMHNQNNTALQSLNNSITTKDRMKDFRMFNETYETIDQ